MAIKRVNLTLALIIEEIDNILFVEENAYYRQICTPKLLQNLTSYALQRVPICYKQIDEEQEASLKASFIYPLEARLHIEEIINQGIRELLVQPVRNQKSVVASVS